MHAYYALGLLCLFCWVHSADATTLVVTVDCLCASVSLFFPLVCYHPESDVQGQL